jgi:hypothetical protein
MDIAPHSVPKGPKSGLVQGNINILIFSNQYIDKLLIINILVLFYPKGIIAIIDY